MDGKEIPQNLAINQAAGFVEAEKLEVEEPQPILFRSTKGINELARTDSRRQGFQSLKTSKYAVSGKYYVETGQQRIIFQEDEIDGIRISARTDRTLTALMSHIPYGGYFSPNEVVRVETTLTDIMDLYGLKDRKSARENIKEDLKILGSLSFSHDKEDYLDIPIRGGASGIDRNGNIGFTFSPDFMSLIGTSSGISFKVILDPALYRVNMNNNPHSWAIARKLFDHYNQNITNADTRCRLSVGKLLAHVTTIPTKEEVEKSDRLYTRRIVEPLERDLNALVDLGVLQEWDYCRSKGEPLSQAEYKARLDQNGEATIPLDYSIVRNLLINWDFTNEYKQQARIEAKEKYIQQIKTDNEEQKKKRAKRIERREKAADKKMGEAQADKKLAGDGI